MELDIVLRLVTTIFYITIDIFFPIAVVLFMIEDDELSIEDVVSMIDFSLFIVMDVWVFCCEHLI